MSGSSCHSEFVYMSWHTSLCSNLMAPCQLKNEMTGDSLNILSTNAGDHILNQFSVSNIIITYQLNLDANLDHLLYIQIAFPTRFGDNIEKHFCVLKLLCHY